MKKIRQPIISILAHVDHGKTTLLDYIRNSRVASKEEGGITQHIGASEVPASQCINVCGKLLKNYNISLKIPGLLFIDTPGHEAFSLLRKRGGMLADIAVLVIDINEGVMPQTKESIELLKQYKTPFVIAANKIDRINGWELEKGKSFLETLKNQRSSVQQTIDTKIYELIGQLYEYGINADRFDRISDFTKTVSIVPISALNGVGVPDLLTMIIGLSQRFLEKKLEIDEKGVGKGTVLELKNVKGLGTTLDIILYDGLVKNDDYVIIGNPEEPIITKAKALLKAKPLKDIRMESKFTSIPYIVAASGFKLSANDIDDVIAGVPVRFIRKESAKETLEEMKKEVQEEIDEVRIITDDKGVVVKADTLGSLEAIINTLKAKNIPIRRAEVGPVTKKDVLYLLEVEDKYKVIFAFNTKTLPEADEEARKINVTIFTSGIIYSLMDMYDEYIKESEELKKREFLKEMTTPVKLNFLSEFVFRQSKPAIVGMLVVGGTLRRNTRLMNQDGVMIGSVHAIQHSGENVSEGKEGEQVAVSIDGATVGRNLKEGDVLYSFITKEEYKKLLDNKDLLKDSEKNILEEIREINVRKDKLWDVF